MSIHTTYKYTFIVLLLMSAFSQAQPKEIAVRSAVPGNQSHRQPPIIPIVVRPDEYTTPQNTQLHVPAPGVLANDDGSNLIAFTCSAPANGTLIFFTDGSFFYTPNAGFVGRDCYTYQVTDGEFISPCVNVCITVTPRCIGTLAQAVTNKFCP